MNKFKKVAVAAVSVVMAGTMAVSFAACGGNSGGSNNTSGGGYDAEGVTRLYNHLKDSGIETRLKTMAEGWDTSKDYWDYLSAESGSDLYGKDLYGIRNTDGTIDYTKYNTNATLNLAVGHEGLALSTSYQQLGSPITMPDGKTYADDDLKPAWAQMGKDLNITFNDVWNGDKTSNNLNNLVNGQGNVKYSEVDLFTTDLSVAVERASAGTSILNLADYLDYMPHFKAFLESNPIVYLSLLQSGMTTEGADAGKGKVIYVAPYFDGNDDIERYCIMRQDWVIKLLNGNSQLKNSTTFKASCSDSVSAQSFMGTTGSYSIESTSADGKSLITIVKNYDAALVAAKDESKPLGEAYKAIAGVAYDGASGNIVDIMNAALTANIEATGDQLADLYRAYIDVCYLKDGSAYFSSSNRANLFNGYDACWDVDDLVALLRIAKTNAVTLTGSASIPVEGIVPRSGQNDRTPDMVRLACQLFGVRGADSRYEYTYIDNDGNLQDARNNKDFIEAMARMNLLTQEGLIAEYTGYANFSYTAGLNTKAAGEAMMMYDYSQTQTLNGFYAEDSQLTGTDVPDGYYFSPVVTPVSKWDVNADGTIAASEYFRFTESWRSVKTGGLAANGDLAKAENATKLKATLQFIDYLYSEDGQIVSTFGPMASDASGTGGFWYNEVATAAQVTAGEYFTYKGVKYAGTEYKGEYTPTITKSLYDSFKGLTVNGFKLESNTTAAKGKLSFTSYARTLIGSTLPVGVKDQSFENQLTSEMGQKGANIVGTGLANGTIKGMTLEVKSDNYWFTAVPTGLPITSAKVNNILNASSQTHLKNITGTGTGKDFFSIMNWVILNGFTKDYNQQDQTVKLTR